MIRVIKLGRVPFEVTEVWQRELAGQRRKGEIPDTLLLLEHPPILTMGRRDSRGDLRVPLDFLERLGIPLVQTDRGGRMTFHGPGQVVGYFIFRLGDVGLAEFVQKVEELLIRTLASFGLWGERDPDHPGVWRGGRKIAALGLRLEEGVTRHGFALNVAGDLKAFDLICPCGIPDRGVTSMEKELGSPPLKAEVLASIRCHLQELFQQEVVPYEGFDSPLSLETGTSSQWSFSS